MVIPHVHISHIDMIRYVNEALASGDDDNVPDEYKDIAVRICDCIDHGDVCYKHMLSVVDEVRVSRG